MNILALFSILVFDYFQDIQFLKPFSGSTRRKYKYRNDAVKIDYNYRGDRVMLAAHHLLDHATFITCMFYRKKSTNISLYYSKLGNRVSHVN